MATAAADWDARFPEFRIGRRGFPPENPYRGGSDYPYPEPLIAAIDRMNSGPDPAANLDSTVLDIAFQWRLMVFSYTDDWFPKKYFPNWVAPSLHPAAQFVGSCILWRPDTVSEHAVKAFSLGVVGVPSNPANSEEHPQVIFYRTLLRLFTDRLDGAVTSGESITREVMIATYRDAMDEAGRASSEASFDQSKHFRYVPVFPGMTSTDWQELEVAVLGELARDRSTLLTTHAQSLRREGMSVQRIAGTLGVSRRTAARMLAE